MNPNDSPRHARFMELSTYHLDGVATDEQFAELSRMLHEDEALRAAFVRMSLQTRLVRHLISPRLLLDTAREQAECATLEAHQPVAAPRKWRIAAAAMVALAAAVVLAVTFFMTQPDAAAPDAPVAARTHLAMITDPTFAQWDVPPTTDANGELVTDRLELKSGSAQIMFMSGATVTLYGPASFQLTTTNSGHLYSGQMIASVPPQAIGFSVSAPGGKVVDLGTEFGLVVDALRATEVHVFQGAVEAEIHDGQGQVLQRRRLTRGQTARLELGSQQIVATRQLPRSFSARVPIDERTYATAVLADHPRMYWPLMPIDDPSPLVNLADASRAMQADAKMGQQIRGAMPGLMYFDGASTLGMPGQGAWGMVQPSGFTVEAWIWPGAMSEAGHIVLAEPGTFRAGWSLMYDPADGADGGHMRFNALGTDSYVFDAAMVRRDRWTHVAVVFDAHHAIHLYVDGRLVQSLQASGPIHPAEQHYVKIGGRAAGERWVGRLAHVAYYPQALSSDQIAEHANPGESQ